MVEPTSPVDRAERVALAARQLGIESALIGAYALAVHGVVRATSDIDLATAVQPSLLGDLRRALEETGLHTELRYPDEQDDLGGVLVAWEQVDDDGDPIDPVEVVNFFNPYRPRQNPAAGAIAAAITMVEKPGLRFPRLADLIAMKLDAGGPEDILDVQKLLRANPAADVDEIRSTCKRFGFDAIDDLIAATRPA